MATLIHNVVRAMDIIAPPSLAADWDNVGLLVGSGDAKVDRVLLTIDLTEAVLAEAVHTGAQMIVAYHPPIFQPLTAVNDATVKSRIVLEAIRAGITVHSPHTALDAAPGGVNDWLCDGFGTGDTRALETHTALPHREQCKIVTFCPETAVEDLRHALASVGAGRIGDYELCSFTSLGTGTFKGGDGTHPVVGTAGTMECVEEVRLEMVCPEHSLPLAMLTLNEVHPYEEPPIEVYRQYARPVRGTGMGRRLVLDRKQTPAALAERIKKHLGIQTLRLAVGPRVPKRISTIGLCAGAGDSMLDAAIQQGCQLFMTGELRHHDALDALSRGCAVIVTGHTNSERGYLKVLRKRLASAVSGVTFAVAKKDAHPFKVV